MKRKNTLKEVGFYLKKCLKNPLRMGSIAPSSKETAAFLAKHVKYENGYVLELGAGTGSFTQGLLESGIPMDKLICVELDQSLCDYLKKRFPGVNVLCGNAGNLASFIPEEVKGNVSVTVSSIPFLTLPKALRKDIVVSAWDVMGDEGRMIQVSYSPFSPVPWQKLGLKQHRYGMVWRNLPPINIFGYEKTPLYQA